MDFQEWEKHFRLNKGQFTHVQFSNKKELSHVERKRLSSSIAMFQHGENSEGKHLMHFAKQWNYPGYTDAIKVFIQEEQEHARILGMFMKKEGIAKQKSHWVDQFFRKIRTWGSIEHSVYILMTAELIAAVYYKALMNAGSSPALRSICQQILIDEDHHLRFQGFTLSHFFIRRNAFSGWWITFHHRILTEGTCIVVWHYHKKVLRDGRYSFLSFRKEVLNERNKVMSYIREPETIMQPLYC
jgi:hypothetical protein